jgi:hypothetical protein
VSPGKRIPRERPLRPLQLRYWTEWSDGVFEERYKIHNVGCRSLSHAIAELGDAVEWHSGGGAGVVDWLILEVDKHGVEWVLAEELEPARLPRARDYEPEVKLCENCGRKITLGIMQGTRFCSRRCERKAEHADLVSAQMQKDEDAIERARAESEQHDRLPPDMNKED